MAQETVVSPRGTDDLLLESLVEVGVNLSAGGDRRRMLDEILRRARQLLSAEAGALFIRTDGHLRFAAAQNDRLPLPEVTRMLLDKQMVVSEDSLAGFVAATGRVVNIPDAYNLPSSAPFRINRDFDAATGYRTVSVLAIPLKRPDGECIGVLESINRLGRNGKAIPFAAPERSGILSLASMAAVTIHGDQLESKLDRERRNTILCLMAAAEFHDGGTSNHLGCVSRNSGLIAEAMGLDEQLVERIRWTAPVHDVGNVAVRDAILLKPAALTPEERKEMERHTLYGAGIIGEPTNPLTATAKEIALTHHEQWDGSGYPKGLAGNDIPLSGRVVAIADAFDAMVSARSYREPIPMNSAAEIIRSERGRHFDPNVVDAFDLRLDELLESYRNPEVLPNFKAA